MSDNMNYWDKVKIPPTTALKKISGGRMNGKTDINPTWRMQVMTELFGPCGVGWVYTVDKLWTEPGVSGEVLAFASVSVSYKVGENTWSAPVPGVGGNMLIAKESAGLRSSDEAYKMAITDALSVALKALGVGAEVYLGNFEGAKYVGRETPNQPAPQPANPSTPSKPAAQAPKGFDAYMKAICEAQDRGTLQRVGAEIGGDSSLDEESRGLLRAKYKEIESIFQAAEQ